MTMKNHKNYFQLMHVMLYLLFFLIPEASAGTISLNNNIKLGSM